MSTLRPELDPGEVSADTVAVTNGVDEPSTSISPISAPAPASFKTGARFWAIIVAISFSGLLTALEATITSTVLPSIIADIGGGSSYVWVINGYFLSM